MDKKIRCCRISLYHSKVTTLYLIYFKNLHSTPFILKSANKYLQLKGEGRKESKGGIESREV